MVAHQPTARLVVSTDVDTCCIGTGVEIIAQALKAPTAQIANNAGYDGSVVVHKVLESTDATFGFNAATGVYEDLVAAGVVDPTLVVRSALQSAAGVASLLTTLDCVIADIPKPEGGGGGGGMGGMGGMGERCIPSLPTSSTSARPICRRSHTTAHTHLCLQPYRWNGRHDVNEAPYSYRYSLTHTHKAPRL